jgi:hypothetical protein
MTEIQKKVGLGVVIVAAVGVVVWQGMTLFFNPPTQITGVAKTGFSAGHTGRMGVVAHEPTSKQ